jgi:hypothetical protein
MTLRAPFPWFGGKSRIAADIWQRFGRVDNYVEPFFGSGAVLLARPTPITGVETINDADGFVANFWRALRAAPDAVAGHVDWPVNEVDLEARHYWLVTSGRATLDAGLPDPDWYDAKIAGWWCWGLCAWIGSGWCSGEGPWRVEDGRWVKDDAGTGVNRQLPHLGGPGSTGTGILSHHRAIHAEFAALSERLRKVRVSHGDWSRVTGDTVAWRHGRTAVFLDPPYGDAADRTANVYASDCLDVAARARAWAIEAGKRPDMLICLAGYAGEHAMPSDWDTVAWKAAGGYGSQGDGRGRANAARETLWFSPACAPARQPALL